MKIPFPTPPTPPSIVLNFNSHQLVFIEVSYSSLFLVTWSSPNWWCLPPLSQPSALKGMKHVVSPEEMHSKQERCSYFQYLFEDSIYTVRPHIPAFHTSSLSNSYWHFFMFCLQSLNTLCKFTGKFCQSYCDWGNLCGHLSYFSCQVILNLFSFVWSSCWFKTEQSMNSSKGAHEWR